MNERIELIADEACQVLNNHILEAAERHGNFSEIYFLLTAYRQLILVMLEVAQQIEDNTRAIQDLKTKEVNNDN